MMAAQTTVQHRPALSSSVADLATDPWTYRGTSPRARLLRRAAGVWMGLLLGVLVVSNASLPGTFTYPALTWACWVALALVWAITLIRVVLPLHILAITGAVVTLVVCANTVVDTGGLHANNMWFYTGLVCVSLFLPTRVSAPAVLALTGAVIAVMAAFRPPWTGEAVAQLEWYLNLGAYGMAIVFALAAASAAARRTTWAFLRAQQAAAAEDREHAYVARSVATQRILHDTIVNTLGAVSRGIRAGTEADLVARASHDLAVLAAPRTTQAERDHPTTTDLADFTAGRASSLGVTLALTDDSPGVDLTADAYALVCAAVSEALLNADKHASGSPVSAHLTSTATESTITITDLGDGDPHLPHSLHPGSVLRGPHPHGVHTDVTSTPGHGTTVTVRWPHSYDDSARVTDDSRPLAEQIRVALLTNTSIWICTAAILSAVAWAFIGDSFASFAGIALAMLVGGAQLKQFTDGTSTRVSTVIALVAIPVVAVIGAAQVDACPDVLGAYWGPNLAGMLTVVVIMTSDNRWVQRGAALLYIGTVNVVMTSLWTGPLRCWPYGATTMLTWTASIVVYLLLRRYLDASAKQTQTLLADQARAEAATRDYAAQYVLADPTRSGHLLDDGMTLLAEIASGEADPRDPDVRARCGEEEQHLRAALALHEDMHGLSDMFVDLIATGRSSHKQLHISRAGEPTTAPNRTTVTAIGALLTGMVEAATDTVTISVFTGTGNEITVVSATAGWTPPADTPPGLQVTVDDLGDQTMTTITWPDTDLDDGAQPPHSTGLAAQVP